MNLHETQQSGTASEITERMRDAMKTINPSIMLLEEVNIYTH